MTKIAAAADLLFQVRQTRQRLPDFPDSCRPTNLTEAYDVQDAVTERLLAHHGGRQHGYKIGCTNAAAQKFLGLDGPFHGALFSALTYHSPVQLSTQDFFRCVIEPEFAFEMQVDLPPKTGAYHETEIAAAVGSVIPAIEIVDSRYTDWTQAGAIGLVADSASHGVWVRGEKINHWQDLDLAQHEMRLLVNGAVNQIGRGEVVLGHPLKALTWLANALNERGKNLKAGQVITTGVCVNQVYDAQAGETIVADFGVLGQVEVVLQ